MAPNDESFKAAVQIFGPKWTRKNLEDPKAPTRIQSSLYPGWNLIRKDLADEAKLKTLQRSSGIA